MDGVVVVVVVVDVIIITLYKKPGGQAVEKLMNRKWQKCSMPSGV